MIRASPGLLVRGSGFSNPRERSILQLPGFSPGENAPSSPINPYVLRDLDDSRTPRASPIRSHGSACRGCSCGEARLAERPELFAWSSASLRMELDAPPPGLKP